MKDLPGSSQEALGRWDWSKPSSGLGDEICTVDTIVYFEGLSWIGISPLFLVLGMTL